MPEWNLYLRYYTGWPFLRIYLYFHLKKMFLITCKPKYEDKVKSNPSRTCPRICCFGARYFVSCLNKLQGQSSGVTYPNCFLTLSELTGSKSASNDFRFGSALITISFFIWCQIHRKQLYIKQNICLYYDDLLKILQDQKIPHEEDFALMLT